MTDAAQPEKSAPKRKGWAGIARMGGYGDNLVAASTLRPLRKLGYKIDVLSIMPHAIVFENNPFVDTLTIKSWSDFPANDPLGVQKWFRSRAEEYERFANLTHACEGTLVMFEAGIGFHWPAAFR